MPRRQLRRASSAVEVALAFMAARTRRRSVAGKAKPSGAISVSLGCSLPGTIRTTATSIPSADVPLMMPATVIDFRPADLGLMRAEAPGLVVTSQWERRRRGGGG